MAAACLSSLGSDSQFDICDTSLDEAEFGKSEWLHCDAVSFGHWFQAFLSNAVSSSSKSTSRSCSTARPWNWRHCSRSKCREQLVPRHIKHEYSATAVRTSNLSTLNCLFMEKNVLIWGRLCAIRFKTLKFSLRTHFHTRNKMWTYG